MNGGAVLKSSCVWTWKAGRPSYTDSIIYFAYLLPILGQICERNRCVIPIR